jgi:hypothetical protein
MYFYKCTDFFDTTKLFGLEYKPENIKIIRNHSPEPKAPLVVVHKKNHPFQGGSYFELDTLNRIERDDSETNINFPPSFQIKPENKF